MQNTEKCVTEEVSEKIHIYIYFYIEICNINFVYYNLSFKILWMAAFILFDKREAAELAKRVGIQCVDQNVFV